MLYRIVDVFPDPIIFESVGPFVSLYQATHRHSPENKQDRIKFRNSLRTMENSLKKICARNIMNTIMDPFYQIGKDQAFWYRTLDGLVILASQHNCIVYRLQRPVEDLLIIADSLHIKPLLRNFQSGDNYQLLGLSRNKFTLYEGNRYGIEQIELDPEKPLTMEEVLGDEHTEPHLSHWSTGGEGGLTMFHGQGGKKDDADTDAEKYFKYVDRFVFENYSKKSKLPLILVATAENSSIFKKLSRNSYLMEASIKLSPESIEEEQLKAKAWELIEPVYLAKTKELVDSFEESKAKSYGSDDLEQIAQAAIENRVKTVLIEADRVVAGEIDISTGKIELFGELSEPIYADVLDDIAEIVLKNKGEVVVLPKERMPGATGAAAIYR